MKSHLIFYLFFPAVHCSQPGLFFWKPRLAIDLSIPTTMPEEDSTLVPLTVHNMKEGRAILIFGFQFGTTVMAIIDGWNEKEARPDINPFRSECWNNIYRWFLRHMSLLPEWIGGRIRYIDTHKLWRRRFYYMTDFIPKWFRWFFPFVGDWREELRTFNRFQQYVEPSFAKHLHYPNKVFDEWQSEYSTETIENLDTVDISIWYDIVGKYDSKPRKFG